MSEGSTKAAPTADAATSEKPLLTPDERANGKILVVDDSRAVRGIVRNALIGRNWSVTTAENGTEAISLIERETFEAVVCDLHMPGVDGFEILKRAKIIDATLPLVVLSAEDDLSNVLRAVREGAFDFVNKGGGDLRPLLAAIDRAVTHCRIRRENIRLEIELRAKVAELDARNRLLQEEQAKSEQLLLNLLPRAVAERLKGSLQPFAAAHPAATVVFADLVGFSGLVSKTPPGLLIGLLDDLFSTFDSLCEQHGVEKIKTIGDAYMAAAGIPDPQPDHARRMADLALDMMHALGPFGGHELALRIGVHSGPVVAGVIGQKRSIFDLWGDTVNIASRMESQGVNGRIQVTETTRNLLGNAYRFEERGMVEVKGFGQPMKTFFLIGTAAPKRTR